MTGADTYGESVKHKALIRILAVLGVFPFPFLAQSLVPVLILVLSLVLSLWLITTMSHNVLVSLVTRFDVKYFWNLTAPSLSSQLYHKNNEQSGEQFAIIQKMKLCGHPVINCEDYEKLLREIRDLQTKTM